MVPLSPVVEESINGCGELRAGSRDGVVRSATQYKNFGIGNDRRQMVEPWLPRDPVAGTAHQQDGYPDRGEFGCYVVAYRETQGCADAAQAGVSKVSGQDRYLPRILEG